MQVLTNFFVECTQSDDKLEELPIELSTEQPDPKMTWILHVDSALKSQRRGVELILINSEGVVIEYALCFLFKGTNNQSEYETLLARPKLAKELEIKYLRIFTDSQLVADQITSKYKA